MYTSTLPIAVIAVPVTLDTAAGGALPITGDTATSRDVCRYTSTVVVQNAGTVNVAGQQMKREKAFRL